MAIEMINQPGISPQPSGQGPPSAVAPKPGNTTADVTSISQDRAARSPRAEEPAASGDARQAVEAQVQGLQQLVQEVRRELRFSVDEGAGRLIVKVLDGETGDVIRQFPSDELLAISEHLGEFLDARQSAAETEGKVGEALGLMLQTKA